MNLESLLAIIGILIAIYALASPIRQRSLPLFIPSWLIVAPLGITASLTVWKYGVLVFGYKLYPWADFALTISSFMIPIAGAIAAIILWQKAKVGPDKDAKLRDFIYASYFENKFDELVRIIKKNEYSLSVVLEPETLDLLFDKRFIRAMDRARTWLHLQLYSHGELVEKLPNRFRVTDIIMRELIVELDSPLHSVIAHRYGGKEYPFITINETELLGKTLQNPKWYMSVRADYPMINIAYEAVLSGKYDNVYNRRNDLYFRTQGDSSRIKCLVYLALKTHVLMLEEATKSEDETDYYVSDLWDLFRLCYDRSRYDEKVWDGKDANWEYPTPFAYLMNEIVFDLTSLCDSCFDRGTRPLGRIGSDMVRTWSFCVMLLAEHSRNVASKFRLKLIGEYLGYMMKLKESHETEIQNPVIKENIGQWYELFMEELKNRCKGDKKNSDVLLEALNYMDYGKKHICDYHKWTRKELNLSEHPKYR